MSRASIITRYTYMQEMPHAQRTDEGSRDIAWGLLIYRDLALLSLFMRGLDSS